MADISYEYVHMCVCVCVVHSFYIRVHAWFDTTCVFCFCTCGTNECDMCVIRMYCLSCG